MPKLKLRYVLQPRMRSRPKNKSSRDPELLAQRKVLEVVAKKLLRQEPLSAEQEVQRWLAGRDENEAPTLPPMEVPPVKRGQP